MNIFIFASFITVLILTTVSLKKQAKLAKNRDKEFWGREARANAVRKKPLDKLHYINIPLEAFPTHLLNENQNVMECINILESLTSQKIVNLTGWSNTDLKLEYGTANINVLTEYDQNYTLLVRTLQKWADILVENDYAKEASLLMEFAITTDTDISRTYYLLADYYASTKQYREIDRLCEIAGGLRSGNRSIIVKHLREKYPDVF